MVAWQEASDFQFFFKKEIHTAHKKIVREANLSLVPHST